MKPDRSSRHFLFVLLAGFLLLLLPLTAPSQNITRVTPEAASPGDLVILTGTFLSGTTTVEFFADVGGFAGPWTVPVTPLTTSATKVTAIVPTMAGFAPPSAIPPGIPVGTVKAIAPLAPVAPNVLPFYYIQAESTVATAGTGSTQNPTQGKPVVGFTIAGGPPVNGNAGFTLTLENAVPGASAYLVLGSPATPPYLMVGDGEVVIDLNLPFTIVMPPFTTNPSGDVQVPVDLSPFPSPVGTTIMAQWLVTGGSLTSVAISNGLQAML